MCLAVGALWCLALAVLVLVLVFFGVDVGEVLHEAAGAGLPVVEHVLDVGHGVVALGDGLCHLVRRAGWWWWWW